MLRTADGAAVTQVPRVTFVKQWPWDASLVERFRVLRAELLLIASASNELREAARLCPRGYPFLREGDVTLVPDPTRPQPRRVTHVRGATLSPTGTLRTELEARGARVHLAFHVRLGAAALAYVTWLSARARLARLLGVAIIGGAPGAPGGHSALAVQRDTRQVLLGATVNRDHLEKMDVRFWTLEELRGVCRHGACPAGEVFRPYFLPVLQTVCDEFQDAPRPDRSEPSGSNPQRS